MPDAAMADMLHHAVPMGEKAAADCDEQPGQSGHGDHKDQGEHGDNSELSHRGCCVMTCGGLSALEPADLQVKPIEWIPARLQVASDDLLRKRSVPPLRRPPRAAA